MSDFFPATSQGVAEHPGVLLQCPNPDISLLCVRMRAAVSPTSPCLWLCGRTPGHPGRPAATRISSMARWPKGRGERRPATLPVWILPSAFKAHLIPAGVWLRTSAPFLLASDKVFLLIHVWLGQSGQIGPRTAGFPAVGSTCGREPLSLGESLFLTERIAFHRLAVP